MIVTRARGRRKEAALTFLDNQGEIVASADYLDLDRKARAIATALRASCRPGDRVLLLYPPGLDFVTGLFGCFYANLIAVPAFPPDLARLKRGLPRLRAIQNDAACVAVLTTEPIVGASTHLFPLAPELSRLRWIASDALDSSLGEQTELAAVLPDDIAFLQYTSGSTSTPKGVALTHANLIANERQIHTLFEHDSTSRVVSWLPPYHDMGLIGTILQPLYAGFPTVLMSPLTFLQRPIRWLEAVSRFRGTSSGGPDFAYRMCAAKITEEEKSTLDLSSWDVAFSGAEPIRSDTLDLFCEAFEGRGFRREAFYPCYGLAEATLIATGSRKGERPRSTTVERQKLGERVVVSSEVGSSGAVTVIGCGAPGPDHRIAIADPDTRRELSSNAVGEIWVSGPSIASGYWNRAQESEDTFGVRLAGTESPAFLRTGDLGFVNDGQLFVTGRIKDLIIVRGRNHYPHDIEATVQALDEDRPNVRAGAVAAFTEEDDDERLVLCVEVKKLARRGENNEEFDEYARLVGARVAEVHGIGVERVVLLRKGSILKTSSGKLQRRGMREWLRGDEAEVIFELRLGASEFVRDMLGTPSSDARDASSPVVVRLRTCTVEQRPGLLSQYLAELLAAATRVASADSIDKRLGFLDMGVDSLTTVELTSRIQRDLDVALEPTAAFNYPTIEKLTAHVLDRLFPAAHVGRAPSRLATLPESDVVERIEALSEEEANEMVAGMEPLG